MDFDGVAGRDSVATGWRRTEKDSRRWRRHTTSFQAPRALATLSPCRLVSEARRSRKNGLPFSRDQTLASDDQIDRLWAFAFFIRLHIVADALAFDQ